MLCYVGSSNIIRRSSEDVAEGEWIPHAVGDIVFADDRDGDSAFAARVLDIDPEDGFRMSLYFPHSGKTLTDYEPSMVQAPKFRVPRFCLKAPHCYTSDEIVRFSNTEPLVQWQNKLISLCCCCVDLFEVGASA